eukprot:g3692.t1
MDDEKWNSVFIERVKKKRKHSTCFEQKHSTCFERNHSACSEQKHSTCFELKQDVYELHSPWRRRHPWSEMDEENLLVKLRTQVENLIQDCPQQKTAKKLANPNQKNYSPLSVVQLLISEYLENPTRRLRRKIYSAMSSEDHTFLLKCVTNKSCQNANSLRFQSLMEIARLDQMAFKIYCQFRIITDPVQLKIYFHSNRNSTEAVESWINRCRDRIHQLPRFYHPIGQVPLMGYPTGGQVPPLEWIEEDTGLETVPVFMKSSFLDLRSGNATPLANQSGVFNQITDPVLPLTAEVILPESVLLAFLKISSDAYDRSFEIPVEIKEVENHRMMVFDELLISKEMDLRQKQELFFSEALTVRFGSIQTNQSPQWSFSKWKFGDRIIYIKKQQDLVAPNLSTPIKIFSKLEYLSEVFAHQKDVAFEIFSSEELAKYWLTLMLYNKAEVYVAHLSPKDGKRLRNTLFSHPDQIFHCFDAFVQFQPTVMNCTLHSVLTYLHDRPPGRYLIHYKGHGDHLCCFKAHRYTHEEVMEERVYDLHKIHENSGKTCKDRIPYIPQQWNGLNKTGQIQHIPHTFPSPPGKIQGQKLMSKKTEFQREAKQEQKTIDYGEL